MAKKQTVHKKTKLDIVLEKADQFCLKLSWPIFLIMRTLFRIAAFIFWRNKYSKRYWEKRCEWRKQKRKLRSKAQKEIILNTMLPILEKQGFQRLPDLSAWGWDRSLQGYFYSLGRLRDNKLQKFQIWTEYGDSYFYGRIEVFILEPMIDDLSELPSYDPSIFYP